MTLNIDKEYLGELGFDYEKIAKEVVEAALDFEKCPYEAEVSLVLTTDEEIRKTNAEFHLMGYDHMEPNEAAVMEKKQEEILEELGILRK